MSPGPPISSARHAQTQSSRMHTLSGWCCIALTLGDSSIWTIRNRSGASCMIWVCVRCLWRGLSSTWQTCIRGRGSWAKVQAHRNRIAAQNLLDRHKQQFLQLEDKVCALWQENNQLQSQLHQESVETGWMINQLLPPPSMAQDIDLKPIAQVSLSCTIEDLVFSIALPKTEKAKTVKVPTDTLHVTFHNPPRTH